MKKLLSLCCAFGVLLSSGLPVHAADSANEPTKEKVLTFESAGMTYYIADPTGILSAADPQEYLVIADTSPLCFAYREDLAESDDRFRFGIVEVKSIAFIQFQGDGDEEDEAMIRAFARSAAAAFGCEDPASFDSETSFGNPSNGYFGYSCTTPLAYGISFDYSRKYGSASLQISDLMRRGDFSQKLQVFLAKQANAPVQPVKAECIPLWIDGTTIEEGTVLTGNWRPWINGSDEPIANVREEVATYVAESGKAWTVTDDNCLTILPDEMTNENLLEILSYMFCSYRVIPKPSSLDDAGVGYTAEPQNLLPPLKGDLDGDGQITALDSSLALRGANEIIADIEAENRTLTPAQEALGDVDGDSELTAFDASCILRYYNLKYVAEIEGITWADVLPAK